MTIVFILSITFKNIFPGHHFLCEKMVSFKQSRFYFLGREIVYVNPSIQTEIIVLLSKQNVLNSLTSLRHSFLLLIVDL